MTFKKYIQDKELGGALRIWELTDKLASVGDQVYLEHAETLIIIDEEDVERYYSDGNWDIGPHKTLEQTDKVYVDDREYQIIADDELESGDKVMIIDSGKEEDLESGKLYDVVNSSVLLFEIYDDASDSQTWDKEDPNYFAVREVVEVVHKDDLVEVNGKFYEKVKRNANKDDLIVITDIDPLEEVFYYKGHVGKAMNDSRKDGDVVIDFNGFGNATVYKGGRWLAGPNQEGDYHVLEEIEAFGRYKGEPLFEVKGKRYEKVDREAKEGDYVVITSSGYTEDAFYDEGHIGIVTDPNSINGSIEVDFNGFDNDFVDDLGIWYVGGPKNKGEYAVLEMIEDVTGFKMAPTQTPFELELKGVHPTSEPTKTMESIDGLKAEVDELKEQLAILEDQISSKLNPEEIITTINLSDGNIRIQGDKIQINGETLIGDGSNWPE